jgi:hypothetical protein
MEFQIIHKGVLYTVSIDVDYNIFNEDARKWTQGDEFFEVKKYAMEYLQLFIDKGIRKY